MVTSAKLLEADKFDLHPYSTPYGFLRSSLLRPSGGNETEVANAPIDNNICERAIKNTVLMRKNAYFYRTENGADVGDLFMSLIHTCELNEVNAFHYLTQLQKNIVTVLTSPTDWMPWNYKPSSPPPPPLRCRPGYAG